MVMTLEQHKAAYRELMANNPRDGSYRSIGEYINSDKQEILVLDIQAERDLRRWGLHRVEAAIPDLSQKELLQFVKFLSEESKIRQEQHESLLAGAIGFLRKASKDAEWLQSIAQLNKLRLRYLDEVGHKGTWDGCWFCDNQAIMVFDPTLFVRWLLFNAEMFFVRLRLTWLTYCFKWLRQKWEAKWMQQLNNADSRIQQQQVLMMGCEGSNTGKAGSLV